MNKATVAIRKAKKKIGNPVLVTWVNKYAGTAGKIDKVHGKSCGVDKDGVVTTWGGVIKPSIPRLLTWKDANTFATTIDNLNVGADHLAIKTNTDWHRIYLRATRNVRYMDQHGTLSNKSEYTMPCHNCGVVLPLEFLQVDHHMPQTGGDDLHILKTMRAMGMTRSAASGSKGAALASGNLGTLAINPKGRDRTYNHLVNPSAADKWTTSEQGEAFLSLLAYVSALDDVARMCKNSILNLVPLCPECNRVKSDWVKPIV